MSSSHQRSAFRSSQLVIFIPILMFGCARTSISSPDELSETGAYGGVNTASTSYGSVSECEQIQLDSPLADSVVQSTQVRVTGSVVARDGVVPQFISVDQELVPVSEGQFDTMVYRQSGSHTLVASCSDHQVERAFVVEPGAMRIVVTSPETASFVSSASGSIHVAGYVENYQPGTSLSFNNMPLQIDPKGQFQTNYNPHSGLNHLDFVANLEGEEVDARHSVLYGQLSSFESAPESRIALEVRQSAFGKLSDALERNLTDEALEELLEPYMGRNGDIELHEIDYDRLEVDFVPENNHIRVRLKIYDFGIRVTYHYFAGRIRGWATVDTAEIAVNLHLRLTSDNQYDLVIEDPAVDLQGFDLDLDGIYSAAEGLIQPKVLEIGQDALVNLLDSFVIEELMSADLLHQTIDLLGNETDLELALTELEVTPRGITALAEANVTPFPPVKDLPGVWTAGANRRPEGAAGDAMIGMSVDLFNRLAAHAVRGGLLDQDLAALLGEDANISSRLSIGILANITQSDLLSTFAATAPVSMRTEALMQPVLQVTTSPSVGLSAALGGFRIHLSSPDDAGDEITWAILELSGVLNIYPVFESGEFQLSIDLSPRVEVIETPLMPLNENAFEDFLETLLKGLSDGVLNDLATDAFNFANIDLFGLGLTGARLHFDAQHPDFLNFAVDVGAR